VIFGGLSAEKEVSLATGRYVYSLIDQQKFSSIPLYLSKDRKIYKLPDKLVIQNKTEDIETRLDEAEEISFEKLKERVDVMFIALLGKYGEDGVIQGLLELLKIPYTGSGILASSLLMQKRTTKQILRNNGIKVADDVVIEKYNWEANQKKILLQITNTLSLPVVVKPSREGSSVGVTYAETKSQLIDSINEALKWDTEIIVEKYIEGKEFMCVVLGNDKPIALNPTQVEFDGKIFTYKDKYMPGKAKYYTPPKDTSPQVVQKIKDIAVQAYKEFGIKGYGRVDGFIVGEDIYVTELHTGTIMVSSSYVFQQASRTKIGTNGLKLKTFSNKGGKGSKINTGFSPRDLISTIIYFAMDAHSTKIGTLQ